MASIVVSGNTSGTITISAPDVSGSNTLTLPASTGTLVTTSGAQTIEFADGSASTPSITNSGDTNTGMFFPAADTIAFAEGGTEAMRLDSSGNVGIGTTSPNGKLELSGTGPVIFRLNDTVTNYWQLESNSYLAFNRGGTERMRIDSSGNLSIGTSSTGGRLTVYASSQNGIELRTNGTADPIYGLYNTGGSSGNAVYVLPCRFGSTNFFAGGVYWSGSEMQYTGTSDIRLKENIVDAGSGLEKLSKVKVRSFDWKESGNHVDFGVIAQELENIAPEAVAKGRDNEDGSINTPYAVDTSVLVPAMIKAIQEQQTIINDLKARITALEAN